MLSSTEQDFIFHHVFLPPKLPQAADEDNAILTLLEEVSNAAQAFSENVVAVHRDKWNRITENVKTWIEVHNNGSPCPNTMENAINSMRKNDVLLLYIKCQNAAILLRKTSNSTIFESFEVQPTTDAVLAAPNALCRSFPAKSISVKAEVMQRARFVHELANRIYKLSIERVELSMEKSYKGGTSIPEVRQSEDPMLVTEWLFAVLASEGHTTGSTITVTKRTRDEIRWDDALIPWRRSGVWLCTKIALQISTLHAFAEDGQLHYKNFMAFTLSQLATQLLMTDSSLDRPQISLVKLARRHAKLADKTFPFVVQQLMASIVSLKHTIQMRWKSVTEGDRFELAKINTNAPVKDYVLSDSFDRLRYIWTESQAPFDFPKSNFSPQQAASILISPDLIPIFTNVAKGNRESVFSVLAVEDWIAKCLPTWISNNTGTEQNCSQLLGLMEAYFIAARTEYHGIPERLSLMLLNIVELWVAIDKITVRLLPLLVNYMPSLTLKWFSSLLLQHRQHLQRLHQVESYLSNRISHASLQVFDETNAKSFAVQYFQSSHELQVLMFRIDADAQEKRAERRERFDQLCKKQEELLASVEDQEHCQFYMEWNGRTRHDRYCKRCKVEEAAHDLKIEKHEWPLPADPTAAKAAVFELQPPQAFVAWRDASWMLLHDLIQTSDEKADLTKGTLHGYGCLRPHAKHQHRRIVLASSVKSMDKSHYKIQDLTLNTLCVDHCMRYRLYDSKDKVWVHKEDRTYSLHHYCVSRTSDIDPPVLGKAVNSTTHGQNSMIADQSACPAELGIHEFVDIGSLRSGGRLQWINLLAILLSEQVNFNNDLILRIVEQLALQVGPQMENSVLMTIREYQQDFLTSTFPSALTTAVCLKIDSIAANWKEIVTARVLLLISQRLLVLSVTSAQESDALVLIRRLRIIGLDWMRTLIAASRDRFSAMSNRESLESSERRLLSIALFIRATWNVDSNHVMKLFELDTDIGDYVECSVQIHDSTTRLNGNHSGVLSDQIHQDHILAAELESFVNELVVSGNAKITLALQRILRDGGFHNKWQLIRALDGLWIANKFGQDEVDVQCNLVTGKLLVGGKPLSLLPLEYVEHEIYQTIFGSDTINVMVSDMSDMEYKLIDRCHNHTVYLGLRHERLVIRSRLDGVWYEAVPLDVFVDDLPPLLIKNCVAWMNLKDCTVSFRRQEEMWTVVPTESFTVLTFDTSSRHRCSLAQGSKRFVTPRSPLGHSITKVFRSFEKERYLHITRDSESKQIEVVLPRYQLNFFVNAHGLLQCRELSSVIKLDQSLDTWHGLRTRVIMSSVHGLQETVLVPCGHVQLADNAPHVEVKIETGNVSSVSYYQYKIDQLLGNLSTNSDLDAHLFKAYLHAVTSSPIPDGLTARTGTATAISTLTDSITKTNNPLSDQAQLILKQLTQLTPLREYYPSDKKVMERVRWHASLSQLSQHDSFAQMVQNIVTHNKQSLEFFPKSKVTVPPYDGNVVLLARAQVKTEQLSAFGDPNIQEKQQKDVVYNSRDLGEGERHLRAFRVADLIGRWPATLDTTHDIYGLLQKWPDANGFHNPYEALKLSSLLEVNITKAWPSLWKLCVDSSLDDQDALRFDLSLMIFGKPELWQFLPSLVAFATCSRLKDIPQPESNSYSLLTGHILDWKLINSHIDYTQIAFKPKVLVETFVKANLIKAQRNLEKRNKEAQTQHAQESKQYTDIVKVAVKNWWPADYVDLPAQDQIKTHDIEKLQKMLNEKLRVWNKNRKFYECCEQYSGVLKEIKSPPLNTALPEMKVVLARARNSTHGLRIPSLLVLLQQARKPSDVELAKLQKLKTAAIDSSITQLHTARLAITQVEQDIVKDCQCAVESIASKFEVSADLVEVEYGMSMAESLNALRLNSNNTRGRFDSLSPKHLGILYRQSMDDLETLFDVFKAGTLPEDKESWSLEHAGLWPQISKVSLLQLLSIQYRSKVPAHWMEYLIGFAQAVTALQRIIRLQKFVDENDSFALHRELENDAHGAWTTSDHPDWLLLEIQNNMLIRPIQIRVAQEIMKNENGTINLGMGEGKSSVILPMVITAMAVGTELVRVVVLKSLSVEMLRALSQSLSGLVNRSVYYLPFSRHTKLNIQTGKLLLDMYKSCQTSAGVLLALPEYLNSFRLIGNDRLSSSSGKALAKELLSIQKWLDKNSRDVLDECDELLKPAYELVYTNGEAKLLQGAPDRWNLVLELMSLIQQYAVDVKKNFPRAIELDGGGQGNSLHVRILAPEAYNALESVLIDAIMQGKVPGLPLQHCKSAVRDAMYDFIVKDNVPRDSNNLIVRRVSGLKTIENLYLIRGLFAKGILQSALTKRYGVNYGLDRSRCLSAVPYRAKSIPSAASEYAQPEMMVLLTTLSFYRAGLTIEDTRSTLVRLHKSPDPADQYAKWISQTSVPRPLRRFASVNLEDATCVRTLHEHLQFNKKMIDFFLAHIVFPKEAKDFPHKLSTSAWDLCARMDDNTTTGFSGTKDSLLPLSMPFKNLPDLSHTPASVLCALLRPENQDYFQTVAEDGSRLRPLLVLEMIVNHAQKPSVIIDVGAQFLQSNHEVARMWLSKVPDKEVAVYFDENDRKMALNRKDKPMLWTSSPFRDQPNKCLFFLDEYHSRGVDYTLPDSFAAAVLLGPKLQKDTLVQACMRMRKLGFTQSVMFFAPPEVHNSICAANPGQSRPTSYEVLVWAISNSCASIRSQKPVWLTKGLAHAQRKIAFARHVRTDGVVSDQELYLEKLREIESRPLSELYSGEKMLKKLAYEFDKDEKKDKITAELLRTWNDMDATVMRDRGLDEEQEREVLHEVEQVREVQRPKTMEPHVSKVNKILLAGIRGERVTLGKAQLIPVFNILQQTNLEAVEPPGEFLRSVVMTTGFRDTVIRNNQAPLNDFLRPVRWILKLKGMASNLILISPNEANFYLPHLRTSETATLFLYSARTVKAMISFDDLSIYTIPHQSDQPAFDHSVLATLRLFAGQLYFSDVKEYGSFCELLGLWDGRRPLKLEGREVATDLFVSPACRKLNDWECTFTESPVKFIHQWINMRRHGIEWGHTHVGRVLNGQMLSDDDFE